MVSPLEDTVVALIASIALIGLGILESDRFFASLGDPTIWLLIGAFVMATGITSSGLALRVAAQLVTRARTPRGLFHLSTLALTLTAFAVPATSGRAALSTPIYAAMSTALPNRPRLVRALSLLFPTVILLSAVASLLGAGAHLITAQLVAASTADSFSFLTWLWLGVPLAVVSSHLACEIVLFRFTNHSERGRAVRITLDDLAGAGPVQGPLSPAEKRAGAMVLGAIALWSTTSLHGISPELVALVGALVAVSPNVGCTTLPVAVKKVPWNLLLFLAATLAMASTLTSTGTSDWLARVALAPIADLGSAAGLVFALAVIGLSIGAHLLIPSRSARSATIIPVVIALAPGLGIEPAAAAFASTAAAGFCHTLTSSAKPVAMFADPDIAPGGFDPADLRRLSAVLAPTMFALVAVFSVVIWPLMGLPLVR